MPSFSERMKYKEKQELQIENISTFLSNRIFNLLDTYFKNDKSRITQLMQNHFKLKINEYLHIYRDGSNWEKLRDGLFSKIYDNLEWNEKFDLVEFIYEIVYYKESYQNSLNEILELENSGYRMINGLITTIINNTEIEEIQTAITIDVRVNRQLDNALNDLSDRENPNYRNSIKESISAVETLLRDITGETTLGRSLSNLDNHYFTDNPQFKQALQNLYNYTNSKGEGIRHAVMDENKNVSYEDAKFMLVTCSAFINYIKTKQSKISTKKLVNE